MSADFSQPFAGADAFSAFWGDFVKRMAGAGMTPPMAAPSPDVLSQIRRAFFDAMSQHADQFMRSEAFLNSMKHAMEQSLAMQQSMNDFIKKGLGAAQMPSRDDADHITQLVRGVEERVLDRLTHISARLDRIENERGGAKSKPTATMPPRPKATRAGVARTKK